MKTNEIQMFARIAALQFDKLYKFDKSADFVLHCRKSRATRHFARY